MIETTPLPAVPATLVAALSRVAGACGTPTDWQSVTCWASTVGLEAAARVVHLVAKELDPKGRWTPARWAHMLANRAAA
ncbi:MAG: hypothetical protein EKK55_06960 [Rhodocyclaceae bacterium]|nr:MAG: hypothetical protein EKK55_06960 [Rhodocyclaceae bacterium]